MQTQALLLETKKGDIIEVLDGDIIGRGAIGKEFFAPYKFVSRRHVLFVYDQGQWYIADMGSVNGTYVDNRKLAREQLVRVKDGQIIKVSRNLAFKVQVPDDPSRLSATQELDFDRVPLAIMFVDLEGSTEYFQEKGTFVGKNWIFQFYDMLHKIVAAHGGKCLKNIGDAILAVFPNGVAASRAAIEIQRKAFKQSKDATERSAYSLRIGINTGNVIQQDNDVFGNAVNIASRIQSLCPPGRIYISGALYNNIKTAGQFVTRFVGLQYLKGVKDKKRIYELSID